MKDARGKERKTERSYGKVFDVVRARANSGHTFTPKDLVPMLGYESAKRACWNMAARGELVLVEAGSRGRPGIPPTYKGKENVKGIVLRGTKEAGPAKLRPGKTLANGGRAHRKALSSARKRPGATKRASRRLDSHIESEALTHS